MHGRLEVICGAMFSGKSEELIRRLRRLGIAKKKIQSFKPVCDTRYDSNNICSHIKTSHNAIPVNSARDILALVADDTEVVGIDEAQFLGATIAQVAEEMANAGKTVIVAGLDTDFRGRPFGPMPELMAVADECMKLSAICVVCGEQASKTFRKSRAGGLVEVGSTDTYEARCRHCYVEGMKNATI